MIVGFYKLYQYTVGMSWWHSYFQNIASVHKFKPCKEVIFAVNKWHVIFGIISISYSRAHTDRV